MIVSPDVFASHLDFFKTRFEVVRLIEWVHAAREGRPLPHSCLCITFDDGWLDNWEFAFPLLKEKSLTATIFLVSSFVGTGSLFWPNRLIRIINEIGVSEFISRFPLLEKSASQCPAPYEIIASLKTYPDTTINSAIVELERGIDVADPELPEMLSWEHVTEMVQSGTFDVGSHTRTHTRLLEGLQDETVYDEVVNSKRELEENLGTKIELFCYPNGTLSAYAQDLVRETYAAGVSTIYGTNATNTTDLSKLKRISLHQGSAKTLSQLRARLGVA